jgi:hypothetical protein
MSVHFDYRPRRPRHPVCWFVGRAISDNRDPLSPCDGRLVRCHLLPQQVLKQTRQYKALTSEATRYQFLYDPRSWVWGCGGPTGLGGHHGQLDTSKRLRVPRLVIPAGTEELAAELGLEWFLDRSYGERSCTPA